MRKGLFLAFLTAVISGFSVFSNKIFVTQADPLAFTVVRNALVGVMLFVILAFSNKLKLLKSLKLEDWIRLTIIGVFGGGLAFALFFLGLSQIGAIEANLIHKTMFIWTAIFAYPILQEKLSKLQILGLSGILIATLGLSGPANSMFNNGIWLVFLATVIWAGENILVKKMLTKTSPEIIGGARMIFGLPAIFMIITLTHKAGFIFDAKTWGLWPLLTSSLFLTAYIITWYKALVKIPVVIGSVILTLAPVITLILTQLILAREIGQIPILPVLGIIAGVYLIIRRKKIFGYV
jgi:drug/metabolite transporter (DMT)-like permease